MRRVVLLGFRGSVRGCAKTITSPQLRDITQLLELGVLKKSPGGGRSTGYELAD